MGITVLPNLYFTKSSRKNRKLGDVAKEGKYYRHPDSALISYPLVVQEPLGKIEKSLNIAIIGGGAAGLAALYELSKLKDSDKNIRITVYESDHESFLHIPESYVIKTRGMKAGRVCAAISGDESNVDGTDHAVYEIGAMRFPEIAGLMWHYASVLFGAEETVSVFPNPGTVPTELLHGDKVDRFVNGKWLDENSPARKIVEVIRLGLVGSKTGPNTSLFPICEMDPAKVSEKLKSKDTTASELKAISEAWKEFTKKNDERTLKSVVREIIEKKLKDLPNVSGLTTDEEKIHYYVALFGTVGFGTGGFKSVFNMSILETMRLMLWDYSNEYMLPVPANVDFLERLYMKALENNNNTQIKSARVCDVAHLDGNAHGDTLVVYYDVDENGNEGSEPQKEMYDYVILATTPKETSHITSKIGFNNTDARRVTLGDHGRRLSPEMYEGSVRPALVLSKKYDEPNSKLFTAINKVHMVCSSKVFATVKKSDFDAYAPEVFKDQGKVKAIVADCGLGSCYVVPSTIPKNRNGKSADDYYSFLISYAWEDESKGLLHHFGKYPMNIENTKKMMSGIISRTLRCVRDPISQSIEPWWFGEALSHCKLEDPLSYDWTTHYTSGAFKLNNAGDNYNSHLLFRYHTHALSPTLKNKFFLANCSYSHLGGWVEGAFMSAVNAVCGLIVAANDGKIDALSPEAQKVVLSFENVVEND